MKYRMQANFSLQASNQITQQPLWSDVSLELNRLAQTEKKVLVRSLLKVKFQVELALVCLDHVGLGV